MGLTEEILKLRVQVLKDCKARFKRRATPVLNSIDRIKFDFSTAVARRLKPSRATAVKHGKPAVLHFVGVHFGGNCMQISTVITRDDARSIKLQRYST